MLLKDLAIKAEEVLTNEGLGELGLLAIDVLAKPEVGKTFAVRLRLLQARVGLEEAGISVLVRITHRG